MKGNLEIDHYKTLGIAASATQAEVKRAYRTLAKRLHPDSQKGQANSSSQRNHDKIAQVNAAYEVLGDVQERQQYDAQRQLRVTAAASERATRSASAATSQNKKRRDRSNTHTVEQWLRTVFNPTDRLIGKIIKPLNAEVRALSADPFDDELMEAFQNYLEACREHLERAQAKFKSMPNPAGMASGAANLYYCLNQLEDGLE